MPNNIKAKLASIGVLFVLGGLMKVAQKQADEYFEAKWPNETKPEVSQ